MFEHKRYPKTSVGFASLWTGLLYLCEKTWQISGPPEFLNNRTEADEEATARDAEHAKRITRKKKKAKPKGTHYLFASL